jgi:putative membrane protein
MGRKKLSGLQLHAAGMAIADRHDMRPLCLSLLFAPTLVWAHDVTGGPAAPRLAQWNFDPWVTVPLAASAFLYLLGLRRLWRAAGRGRGLSIAQAAAFAAGWIALMVALVSPLDAFGGWSFAWHMLQHEVLMLIAAPLLVIGRPLAAWAWAVPSTMLSGFGGARSWHAPWRLLSSHTGAWTIALWGWHAPAAFNASVLDDTVHTLQHLSFLLTALLFWWAVLGRGRGAPGGAVVSLLTTMVHTGVLGALLTLSPVVWYAAYAERLHAAGIDALADQQIGGLIMWVPAGMVYLIAALFLAQRWLRPSPHTAPRGVPFA